MSSILDALDRAEQERRRDHSFTTGEVPGPARRSWSLRGFWILAGILLLGNLIVWLLVWRTDTPVDPGSVQQAERETVNPPGRRTTAPPPASAQEAEHQGAVARPSSVSIEEQLKRRARPGVRPLLAEAMLTPTPLSAQASHTAAVGESASPSDSRVSRTPDTGSAIPSSTVEREQSVESPAPTSLQPNAGVVLDGPENMESTLSLIHI